MANPAERLRAAIEALPLAVLWALRRDLAMGPFDKALHGLHFAGGPAGAAAAALLAESGDAAASRTLGTVLGPGSRCWLYSSQMEAVIAGQAVLDSLPREDRAALLEALHSSNSFCATVREHLGRRLGAALLKLGRVRVAWLLGADAGDPVVVALRRQRAADAAAWSSGRDSDSGAELDRESVDEDASTCAGGDGCSLDLDVGDGLDSYAGAAPTSRAPAPSAPAGARPARGLRYTLVGRHGGEDSGGGRNATLAFLRAFREHRRRVQESR